MFADRFTDRARRVMGYARREAQRFNHEYIGTEHILLGLVKEGSGVAANVLRELGVDLKQIGLEVEKLVQSGPETVAKGGMPLTPRAKHVLELALEEARSFGHNYVGTEHLLLGLLCERESVAAHVLMNLGLKLEDVRVEVERVVGVGEKAAGGASEPVPEGAAPGRRTGGTYELKVEGEFAAAHRLRGYEGECERLHGHNWRVEVVFTGRELNGLGMLIDFRDARQMLRDVLEGFDHVDLNELECFQKVNPTTENMARFVCEELRRRVPEGVAVQSVTAWESPRCGVTYRP